MGYIAVIVFLLVLAGIIVFLSADIALMASRTQSIITRRKKKQRKH